MDDSDNYLCMATVRIAGARVDERAGSVLYLSSDSRQITSEWSTGSPQHAENGRQNVVPDLIVSDQNIIQVL